MTATGLLVRARVDPVSLESVEERRARFFCKMLRRHAIVQWMRPVRALGERAHELDLVMSAEGNHEDAPEVEVPLSPVDWESWNDGALATLEASRPVDSHVRADVLRIVRRARDVTVLDRYGLTEHAVPGLTALVETCLIAECPLRILGARRFRGAVAHPKALALLDGAGAKFVDLSGCDGAWDSAHDRFILVRLHDNAPPEQSLRSQDVGGYWAASLGQGVATLRGDSASWIHVVSPAYAYQRIQEVRSLLGSK